MSPRRVEGTSELVRSGSQNLRQAERRANGETQTVNQRFTSRRRLRLLEKLRMPYGKARLVGNGPCQRDVFPSPVTQGARSRKRESRRHFLPGLDCNIHDRAYACGLKNFVVELSQPIVVGNIVKDQYALAFDAVHQMPDLRERKVAAGRADPWSVIFRHHPNTPSLVIFHKERAAIDSQI